MLTEAEKRAHLLDQGFVDRIYSSFNPREFDMQQFRSGRKTTSKDIAQAIRDRQVFMYGGLRPELYDKVAGDHAHDHSLGVFSPQTNEGFIQKGSPAGTLNHELNHLGRLHETLNPDLYPNLAKKYNPRLNLLDKLDRDVFNGLLPFTPFRSRLGNRMKFGKEIGDLQHSAVYDSLQYPYDTQYMFDKVGENTEFTNTAVDSFNQGKLKFAFNDYDSRVARGEIEPNPKSKEPLSRRAIKTVRGWMGLE